MSTKRQPSKQKRQTQNQKQRAALEARRAAAAASASPSGKQGGTTPESGSGSGSMLSRLRGGGTRERTPRTPRTTSSSSLPVGHRAALSALIAAVAGAVVGSLLFRVPVDRSGEPVVSRETLVAEWTLSAADAAEAMPDATPAQLADSVDEWSPGGDQPYAQAFFPVSLAVLLPVIGTGIGFRTVSRRSPAKLVNRTMYITLFGALLTSQLLLIFLPSVISLAVAAFQVRKAEMAAARAAAAAEGGVGGSGDVIDVEEAP